MAEFPWQAFMEAVKTKNANRQQAMDTFGQSLAGLGQNIGQHRMMKSRQQGQQQLQQALTNSQEPVNGPPTSSGGMPQQPPMDVGAIVAAMQKAGVDPSSFIAERFKLMRPVPEWSPVPGMLTKEGYPLMIDKFSGGMKQGPIPATATGGSAYAGIREKQFGLQDLPSNQGPSTAAGAAYQVKVAARQGKSLIAKAGSAQRTGLAQGDLARAVLRNSPTDEAMRNGNFSDNLVTRWSQMKQKLTADPGAVNNPAIRKEIYSIFDEMDKSATPFIQNQLDDMVSAGFKLAADPKVRKRQLGETLPDIPFIDTTPEPAGVATGGAWGIQRVQ